MAQEHRDILSRAVGVLAALFLLVTLAVGLLGHFGFFGPDADTPESCVLIPGLECLNFSVSRESVVLVIGNNLGYTIVFERISVREEWGKQRCAFHSSTGKEGLPLLQGQMVSLTSDPCKRSTVKQEKRYSYRIDLDLRSEENPKTMKFKGKMIAGVVGH